MLDFLDIVGLTVMVLLRFGVPLALMAGAAYFLKRLDARWEAEARVASRRGCRGRRATGDRAPGARSPRTAPPRGPRPIPTFIPPPVDNSIRLQPGMMMAASAQHCWDEKGCTEEAKASCAAPANPGVPCWQAHLDAAGKIPEQCVECDVFQRYPTM